MKPSLNAAVDEEDLHAAISEQLSELMAERTLESDLDFAFQLQLQEALAASLAFQPSTSSSSIPQEQHRQSDLHSSHNDGVSRTSPVFSEKLTKLESELQDREQSEIELRRVREDISRRIHDQKVAREILRIPEEEWIDWGDSFEKPFGQGCSRRVENDVVFRLYFKGLVSEEKVRSEKVALAGIGVAICDPRDNLIFEVRKPLVGNGMSKIGAEAKALIEGLNAAFALELKHIIFYCDYYPLFQFINRRWPPKQRKISMLVNQVTHLQRKFNVCRPLLVARKDIKFAFKLARDAIESQLTRTAELNHDKKKNETCVICLEDCDINQILTVDGCLHRYCFSCMKQHIEVKLLHGMVPKCPHEGCKSDLSVDSCTKILTPKYIETMRQRIKEASIPVSEKIYCPYPRCSALMSKSEVLDYTLNFLGNAKQSEVRKCKNCHGLFCINCKVPWHNGVNCSDYKRLNPNPQTEDLKLKSLATMNFWRQCKKCSHMIELSEGCNHMTCRCGYEFCYNCGAEWKDKAATCSCPGWEEGNVWYVDNDRYFDDEEEEDEDEDNYENYDSDSNYF